MEEEEAIEGIRESSRNLLLMNRRQKRDAVSDEKRPLPNLRPNPDAVTQIANKLKTKAAVTASELRALKNSLIDDAANIEIILHTHGALRGIVRELSSHELNKQYEAIGCCCNLGLGDSRAGLAVTKAAGPYLIAALDSLNADLAISSAWALGNLAGSGPKASEVLLAQGCVARLTHLLVCNYEDLRESVLYALVHLCNQLKDNLPPEYVTKILSILPRLRLTMSAHLLFILSCHREFKTCFQSYFLLDEFILKVLHFMSVSIEKSHDDPNIVYVFRLIANMNCVYTFDKFLSYFVDNDKMHVLKKLLETDQVNESVLWFLGNAYKCCSEHTVFKLILS
nr:Importin alpha 3 [Spodoptera frugiperda]